MFKATWSIGKENFDRIAELRRNVNVLGRGIDEAAEFDALDAYAGHVYVCEAAGAPIAAGRMYPDNDSLIIDRIAVMSEYEPLPYAELTLRMLLFKAQELPQRNVRIICEECRFALVERFGFVRVGEIKAMHGTLMAEYSCPTDKIIWDSACAHM